MMKDSEIDYISQYGFSQEEWLMCLKVLEILKDNPLQNPDNDQFKTLVTKIHKGAQKTLRKLNNDNEKDAKNDFNSLISLVRRNARKQERKENNQKRRQEMIEALKHTEIGQLALTNKTRYTDEYQTESFKEIPVPLNCYCCNQPFQLMHHFYGRLCPSCATFNYQQRFVSTDLTGRNAIITGARVKVGYATTLKLLRSGANVIATTRFPALAMKQFAQEVDFEQWQARLCIYGLDLRHINAVENFMSYVKAQFQYCDLLINNAAQTIKYPDHYYAPLIQNERLALTEAIPMVKLIANNTPVSGQMHAIDWVNKPLSFDVNRFGQPIDYREKNSWNSTLAEIDTFELLEVNLINHIAPYLLIKALKPLFLKSPYAQRFIINVTSSEGQFSYQNKTVFHPHTNMTKAALNMMTRTSAAEFVADGIFMNSVDVGWISTGACESLRQKQFEQGYVPPLDSVDGAARIMHPIILGLQGEFLVGKLLKNYQVVDW